MPHYYHHHHHPTTTTTTRGNKPVTSAFQVYEDPEEDLSHDPLDILPPPPPGEE